MALIKCPECGREISDTCKQCIHCGYALKEEDIEKYNAYLKQHQNSSSKEYYERLNKEVENRRNVTNEGKKVMSMGEAKLCMVIGPICVVAGIFFLITFFNSNHEDEGGWFLFWLGLFCFILIGGIVSTIKGFNAYSYHKSNDE